MGVKVKLADNREVGDRSYRAGDVVDVHPRDARLLLALGAGAKVDDGATAAAGEPVPEAVPGNADLGIDDPAVGDQEPTVDAPPSTTDPTTAPATAPASTPAPAPSSTRDAGTIGKPATRQKG